MNNIYDVLEICLQEIESGADMESVLARYPDFAGELRPILKVSAMARMRGLAASEPSPEAVRHGRAKVMQHAAQMREAKVAPRSKRVIPIFQRLAISLTLTAIFLSSGTGLVSASSSALPGENLYPVKLTWENVRLFFSFNEESREALEHEFENERLHEVNELFVEGKKATIQFSGVYMDVNGVAYVSGIHIVIVDTSNLPTQPLVNGVAVSVTGHTNAQGFVEVESIKLLPAGAVVPTGEPVENETEDHSSGNGNGSESLKKDGKGNDVKIDDNINDRGGDSGSDGGKVIENSNSDDANDNSGSDNNNGESNSESGSNSNDDNSGSGKGGGDDGSHSGSGGGGGDDSGSGGGGDD
jgi:uncharacterized membrane protein YgcG